jgi:hypothetical protein
MKKSLHKMWEMSFVAVLLIGIALAGVMPSAAQAATQNYSTDVNVTPVAIVLSGQRTATVTGVASIKVPAKMKLIGVSATARASGGTTPTLTVDVLAATTSLLSAPFAITAGAVAEGTIATSIIADETVVNINLAITGTNPTWDDISILLTFIPI